MTYRVLLVGGGTGGHVYPLVAVARELQAQAKASGIQLELLLFGDGPFLARAAKEAHIPYRTIMAPKLRRDAETFNPLDFFKIPFALVQSFWRMFWFMPDVVFAKGGYTCALPTLAARFFMIPVYLHESDSVPGATNRMLAKRSKLVFTAFTSADQYFAKLGRPTMLVGNPFRPELSGVDHVAAVQALGLAPDKKTLLVIGGSQGAQQLNELILNGLVEIVQKGYNVIHQVGDKNFVDVKKAVEQYMTEGATSYAPLIAAQYRVYPFFDQSQLATAYAACDIALTRGSAGVLTELSYLSKPMIIVPLASAANDHQTQNAIELEALGAIVMDSANATPNLLISQLNHLADPTRWTAVATRIHTFAKPDAAQHIATVLLGGS